MATLDWIRTKVNNLLKFNTSGDIKPDKHKEFVLDTLQVLEEHIDDESLHCPCDSVVENDTDDFEYEPTVDFGYFYNYYVLDNDITSNDDWRVFNIADYEEIKDLLVRMKREGVTTWNYANELAENYADMDIIGTGIRMNNGIFSNSKITSTFLLKDAVELQTYIYISYDDKRGVVINNKKTGSSLRLIRDFTVEEEGLYGTEADGFICPTPYEANDGIFYNAVKVGLKWITNTNLKETKYRNGTNIPKVQDATAWSNLTTGAYCEYE